MNDVHLPQIREAIRAFDPKGENRYFVFGSAARPEKFHDIDLGVEGNGKTKKNLEALREILYNAPIPYHIDVVDMDEADADFRDYVLNEETKVWI